MIGVKRNNPVSVEETKPVIAHRGLDEIMGSNIPKPVRTYISSSGECGNSITIICIEIISIDHFGQLINPQHPYSPQQNYDMDVVGTIDGAAARDKSTSYVVTA